MDLLTNLNPTQRQAVKYNNGPVLILAGAGSGKTRVLTHRIAYLIKEEGYSPDNILAVTFTNKAANEMKERIKVLLQSDAYGSENSSLGGLWIGTFHSICLRILRKELSLLGLNGDFVIYDESDQLRLIKECLQELKLDEKYFNPRGMLSSISRAKDKLLKPGESFSDGGDFYRGNLSKIYELYQEKLRINGAMDFGDLLFETVNLLRSYPNVLRRYQEQFKEVLVDEFQDTNLAQHFLAKILTAENANLWVVGDEDQSIYSWRGAEVRNIVDLEKDYPDLKIFRLEQNYRSTGMILKAANSLVEKNKERLGKTLWTENGDGEKVVGHRFANEHREAMSVGRKILDAVDAGKNYRDVAIFYRTNAQSRVIEEEFLRLGMPYAVIGGVKFYERMEIKDILAYLRVLVNPNDSVSLKRIINTPPRGIGKVTRDAISRLAAEDKIPFYHAIKLSLQRGVLSKGAEKKLGDFVALIEKMISLKNAVSLHELVKSVLDFSGYMKMWEDDTSDGGGRVENIKEFFSAVKDFEERKAGVMTVVDSTYLSLEEFLDMVSLVTGMDLHEDGYNRVSLMTLHSAKGLEFPIVFMVGLEERLFPHSRSFEEGTIEEERRLCYVGMTRAKEKLSLSGARERRVFGVVKRQIMSRFMDEIDPSYFSMEAADHHHCFAQFSEMEYEESALWNIGERVRHPTFGVGTVKAKEGSEKLTVLFNNVGLKKLLLSYTTLERA